jgi:hypothetical protein
VILAQLLIDLARYFGALALGLLLLGWSLI